MRSMTTQRSSTQTITLLIIAGLCGTAHAQTLVGDTVEWWGYPQAVGSASLRGSAQVVTPGYEFSSQIGEDTISTLNVEATSIRLDALLNFFSPYFNTGFDPTYYEIRDLDFVGEPERYISGVDVSFSQDITVDGDSPVNWPDFSANNVTFTADTDVPAPATAGLLVLGGLTATRRRRH